MPSISDDGGGVGRTIITFIPLEIEALSNHQLKGGSQWYVRNSWMRCVRETGRGPGREDALCMKV